MTPEFALGYSNPFEAYSTDEHRGWAGLVLAGRIRGFLDHSEAALRAAAPAAFDALGELARRLSSGEPMPGGSDALAIGWHPFAACVEPGAAGAPDPLAAAALAARAMLRLAAFGPVEANFRLAPGGCLMFDRFRIPAGESLGIASDGSICRIAGGAGGPWHFRSTGRAWSQVAGASLSRCSAMRLGGTDIFICPVGTGGAAGTQTTVPSANGLEALGQALGLISRVPAYAGWVERTLRVISPLPARPGCYDSETFAQLPACLFASLQPDPVRTAETIIHEVSHDHLHLMLALDGLVEPGSVEKFYSPPKKCVRPALGILKAHHAFGNVLCFYYLLRASGVPLQSRYARSIAELETWDAYFTDCLKHARSLTPVAEALWRPLARRVAQLGALAGLAAA